MTVTRDAVLAVLDGIAVPGGTLRSRDMVRALGIDGGSVRFVIEAPSAEAAQVMEPMRAAAQAAVEGMAGVTSVSVALVAEQQAPSLKIGRHPTAQAGPQPVPGVARIVAVGSGKGGVGKSTVSSNLAVALARQGRRVGLLDADIYGPSQPRMMGVSKRPASPDGKTIIRLPKSSSE